MSISENQRKSQRSSFKTKVEFYVDADIIHSESVNVSENGIQFESDSPLIIKMRMNSGGVIKDVSAKLVWSRHKDGNSVYGLEYISEPQIRFIKNYGN